MGSSKWTKNDIHSNQKILQHFGMYFYSEPGASAVFVRFKTKSRIDLVLMWTHGPSATNWKPAMSMNVFVPCSLGASDACEGAVWGPSAVSKSHGSDTNLNKCFLVWCCGAGNEISLVSILTVLCQIFCYQWSLKTLGTKPCEEKLSLSIK